MTRPSASIAPAHHPRRWRLSRAGIVNVWHYLDTEFTLSGGRLILRGTNGSGKSRALEMLLPYLLDGDRKRMDATGAGKVNLDELMRTGAGDQDNRVGYLWIELACPDEYFTIGAHIRYSAAAHRSEVHLFTTGLRVGHDLTLVDEHRMPLSRDDLIAAVGADRVTRSPEEHRDTVRTEVFGLRGESGRDRYTGLLQLLHTLRSPDVGNRIDEGRLPQILSDALPPLSENLLTTAGDRLDGLTETRTAQEHLEETREHLEQFHEVYRRYATHVLREAADAAAHAADRVATTTAELAEADADAADLEAQSAAADTRLRERRDQLDELERAVRGLESRPLFRDADDLAQRRATVAALADAAEQALDSAARARHHEQIDAEVAAEHVDELTAAVSRSAELLAEAKARLGAASMPHTALPTELLLHVDTAPPRMEPVRTDRDTVPAAQVRPAVADLQLRPDDLESARDAAHDAAIAAQRRSDRAGRRLEEARRLEAAERTVHTAEADAERTAGEAERDRAELAESTRVRDDAAIDLNRRWRAWITDPRTVRLLPTVEQDGPELLQVLATDLEALTGTGGADADAALTELDRLPDTAARAARDGIAAELAALELADHDADAIRTALLEERKTLEADRQQAPEDAPWRRENDGVPLWRAVEFADSLGVDDRAGVEAALLAAGLLTATVDGDGRLRAQSGQVLVSPRNEPPRNPLSTVLVPSPTAPVPETAIATVLAAIGFEDAGAIASVSRDGRWHNGVLRGRHTADEARFIGGHHPGDPDAPGRHAERLDEIAAELAAADVAAAQRAERRRALEQDRRDLDTHLPTAPRSIALREARIRTREHEARARRSAEAAVAARDRAAELRARWSADLDTHRATCAHFEMPSDVAALEAVVEACADAGRACVDLARGLDDVRASRDRHSRAVHRFADSGARRVEAEAVAEARWHEWHGKAAVVAAQHEAVAMSVAELEAELSSSVTEQGRTEEQCRRTQAHREQLGKDVAQVRERCSAIRERLVRDREELAAAAATLSARLQLPSIAAATDVQVDPLAHTDDPDTVRAVADAVRAALPAVRATGQNRVLAALQQLARAVSGQLDVEHTVDDGVHVVRISGAGADGTPTEVLEHVTARVDEGRRALTQRERDVFTGFVLGGVADELRRRIERAGELVDAMNASLSGSRTSHGIGVRIGWVPNRGDDEIARITALLADPTGPGNGSELIDLLRRRVEASHTTDPSAGYAAHLAQALDYRNWHTVDVTILGPEPDQERRISKRAKISQGETRFVSYVTLFAAADGYLSSLPDVDRALRLVLLDDAFAKIDDPTIGELMGLLVRLDIDFVMTGHALWGCVPQVPALDIYEVRRLEDSSAVTTHVHWDGHNRHLRPLD
ncbi:TIGR02680 family protein [Rhodococcus sp. HM1]|uniref:TIGR02680 family protein n=1 Tax=Rhodococcus sp. HM1 TaxID=2937759 RepID=UPI00200A00F0|nr:TIGR02680 family protein [Rhodococcus sp. HM1]MCK8674063.1 TIGR02680 family protein [Rhodococcus sp. HM1]